MVWVVDRPIMLLPGKEAFEFCFVAAEMQLQIILDKSFVFERDLLSLLMLFFKC
jgi:hypothetical protein